ncbi:hypothetical protein A4X13_0g569 [Tilletia indica]|uniref:Uncharacterized protein n=1 Tax=Tilletia indica TaxID=43049 RepID=A0A177TJ98_9BASI|nr:hypothetical protein A4X13_0g569 [Tilletia indica]
MQANSASERRAQQDEAASTASSSACKLDDELSSRPAKVQLPDFEDVTEVFRSSCSGLQQGQMVHIPGFTMMDSMGAIQIMDRRMDSGMAAPLKDTPVNDRLSAEESETMPEFDPDADLSVEETCWIMDRLLACETRWQAGSALSQTIQTCLYIHNPDYLYCGHGDQTFSDDMPDTLASTVLRAYLVALLKCCCLAWDEMSKGQVLDGEDWTGDKAGCSLLEDLDASEVLSLLEDTVQSVRRKEGCCARLSDANVEAIATRLQFRKHLLMSMMVLSDPYLSMLDELQMHAHFIKSSVVALISSSEQTTTQTLHPSHGPLRLRTLPSPTFQRPGRVHAPSLRVKSTFDPAYSRKLTSMVPLRPISLPEGPEVRTFWTAWAEGLQMMLHFGSAPSIGLGWTQWQSCLRLRASRFQRAHPAAYLRSVMQSVICNQNHLVAGKYPPVWHAHVFLRELAAVDVQEVSDAVAIQWHSGGARQMEHHSNSISNSTNLSWQTMAVRQKTLPQALDSFYGRLGGNLASYLSILCQNRSRQKRSLAKACKQWANLAEEAQELERRLSAEVRLDVPSDVHYAAIQHLSLDIMLDILFCGFELELYKPDEWISIYWLAAEVANEQSRLCSEFAEVLEKSAMEEGSLEFGGQGGVSHIQQNSQSAAGKSARLFRHRSLYADLLAQQCSGHFGLLILMSRVGLCAKPSTDFSSNAAQLAVFRRRLKWLEPAPRLQKKADMFWDRFCAERASLQKMKLGDLAGQLQTHFTAVQQLSEQLSRWNRSEARTELCEQLYKETLQQFKEVAKQSAATCTRLSNQQEAAFANDGRHDIGAGLNKRWYTFDVHPWFPCCLRESSSATI